MSKFKNGYENNQKIIISSLQDAFNAVEGQYSNIPECCIYDFLSGLTYEKLKNNLEAENEKVLLKNLKKFNYVPCAYCLEKAEPNELKLNGTSDLGKMILAIIDIVQNKEKSDARKANRRSKK